MSSIVITPSDPQDLKLLASIAQKMGFATKIIDYPPSELDEATRLAEPALAEDWLSEEDEAYNGL